MYTIYIGQLRTVQDIGKHRGANFTDKPARNDQRGCFIDIGSHNGYHINCLGNVIIDGEIKSISGIQIAEFMRLR